MCGIVGYTHLNRPFDRGLIQKITPLIRHRGPDQEGVYTSAGISMGAVRLKIIDLAGGQQPMASEDGRTILVYNGEIYNYRELRAILKARGHQFKTESDTEVLLHAFLEWDTGCFSRLKGMFAAAFWQEGPGRLVLTRDRMGIKPLYFSRQQGQLYFGSELKVLLVHPEISRELDIAALDQYLTLNYVPSPATLIQGIEKLSPGHFLEWRAGNVTSSPFWELRFQPDPSLTEPEALEELDRLLREAVRQHLISDVPLGVLLSGGVDSSTMVYYAAAEASGRLKTFSVSFSGRSFDERRYFRQVAEQFSTDHHEFDLSRDLDLEETIREFAQYADEPCGDSSSLPVWYLSKLCREHVTVTLSGEGADELFGGYLTYQADRLVRWIKLVPAPLRRWLLNRAKQFWPVSEDKISLEYMVKRFLEGSFLPSLEAHCYWNGAFSVEEKQRILAYGSAGSGIPPIALNGGFFPGFLNQFLWFDQKYYLTDDILAKVDRMSMAHSLEVRPPFLDHELVEFAARLPEHFKIRGRQQKYLLKKLMRGRLPELILRRKKMGFDIPAHDWLRRELKPLLLETISPAALGRTGLFRPQALEALVQAHLDRRINAGFHLWGLLILLLWMEKWQIQSPASPSEVKAEATSFPVSSGIR